MNTLQRIKLYLDFKGISNQKFEISIGLSNGAFGNQLKNNRTIGVDKLEKILSVYHDVNPNWLLTGDGEMIRDTQDHQKGIIHLSLSDLIEALKREELTFDNRLKLVDQILLKLVDLTNENSRLKSELLDALRSIDRL